MARRVTGGDLEEIAGYVIGEYTRRAESRRRKDLERIWQEVDRQVLMRPARNIPKGPDGNSVNMWMPNVELPLQFNTLEVLTADSRRLILPPGNEWYRSEAQLTDEYARKVEEEGLILGDELQKGVQVDQETANAIVHATMDHYMGLYRFRDQWDLCNVEALKYGTLVARAQLIKQPIFTNDYRGVMAEENMIPAFIPMSVRNVYLDDTYQAVMHEGMMIQPSFIRTWWQGVGDLEMAAAQGGRERGWIPSQMKDLAPQDSEGGHRGQVMVIEFEGDIFIRRSQGEDIFLPNQIVWVLKEAGGRVIRKMERKQPFRSYIVGHYMRDDLQSPYGVSPLMKGQPLQEAATEAVCSLLQAGVLNANPPVEWSKDDMHQLGQGGPKIFPGSKIMVEVSGTIKPIQIGDSTALLQVYLALAKQYEDLTGVNDPRRGGGLKSHTTAQAADIEASRGVLRTEDYVNAIEEGPMRTWLYMAYELTKEAVGKKRTTVFVDTEGMKGHIEVTRAVLPDKSDFIVNGARGILSKREERESWLAAQTQAVQLVLAGVQLGDPLLFEQNIKETYGKLGFDNAERFIAGIKKVAGGGQGIPGMAPPAGGPGSASPAVPAIVPPIAA